MRIPWLRYSISHFGPDYNMSTATGLFENINFNASQILTPALQVYTAAVPAF